MVLKIRRFNNNARSTLVWCLPTEDQAPEQEFVCTIPICFHLLLNKIMPQCNGQKKEEDSVNSINAHLSERKSAKAENITGSKQYLTNNTKRN